MSLDDLHKIVRKAQINAREKLDAESLNNDFNHARSMIDIREKRVDDLACARRNILALKRAGENNIDMTGVAEEKEILRLIKLRHHKMKNDILNPSGFVSNLVARMFTDKQGANYKSKRTGTDPKFKM
ncbi:MAG: hypothetical protein U9N14_05965 [Pseudomonadota bacterium]|nr:hypothetical protein [Pseudomonadota bacterium]